jgi:hypothetical protein
MRPRDCISISPDSSRSWRRSALRHRRSRFDLPLGRSQSNLSLSHTINFLGAVGARAGAGGMHCDDQRLDAVHVSRRRPQSGSSHPFQHRLADVDGVGRRSADRTRAWIGCTWFCRARANGSRSSRRSTFFSNTILVAGAIALSTRQPLSRVWHRNFLWSAPSYLAGAALAALATAAPPRGWFGWLLLLAAPLYLVFRSYHTVVARLREEQDQTRRAMDVQLATIEALALAIEARGGCTPEHIRSIQHYAATLAEAAGLSDAEVQAVRTAALLHDIGNMAVPEHILSKPDALTPEDSNRVKIPPARRRRDSAERPVRRAGERPRVVHHERGMGSAIRRDCAAKIFPWVPRILAIADCFSTLQADRPYRPAAAKVTRSRSCENIPARHSIRRSSTCSSRG